jgi:hypothetical protein
MCRIPGGLRRSLAGAKLTNSRTYLVLLCTRSPKKRTGATAASMCFNQHSRWTLHCIVLLHSMLHLTGLTVDLQYTVLDHTALLTEQLHCAALHWTKYLHYPAARSAMLFSTALHPNTTLQYVTLLYSTPYAIVCYTLPASSRLTALEDVEMLVGRIDVANDFLKLRADELMLEYLDPAGDQSDDIKAMALWVSTRCMFCTVLYTNTVVC